MGSNKGSSKLILVFYRSWAIKVAHEFAEETILINSKEKWDLHNFNSNNHYIFIGWSWLIPTDYITYGNCYCIHPSDLPKYRGGSPIQNQVINGVTTSCVTLFQMDQGLDSGPIFDKIPISLDGYLDEILSEIIRGSIEIISKFKTVLDNNEIISLKRQNLEEGFICKRRSPKDSVIAVADIVNLTPKQIYDMVRGLQEPYPKLIFEYPDGSRLILNNVSYAK
jgi:methionyl-tRNA formyltransferase